MASEFINLIQQSLLPLDQAEQPAPELKCAAVLVPLFINKASRQWEVLLTQRAAHLKHHPGQISFPGGKFEREDASLSHTALRETFEEVGLNSDHIQLVGQLPQQKTSTAYNITPFVGVINRSFELKIDHGEVAEAFSLPLNFLIDPDNHQRVIKTVNQVDYSFYLIEHNRYKIWGATAKILVNLSRRLAPLSPP